MQRSYVINCNHLYVVKDKKGYYNVRCKIGVIYVKRLPIYILSGILVFLLGVLCCLLFTKYVYPGVQEPDLGSSLDVPSDNSGNSLIDTALEVAGFIKSGSYESLAEAVHPIYGLVFSPYATVNLSTNRSFSVSEVKGFGENTQTYVWGIQTDTSDPIRLTVADYFREYVFDRDYTQPSVIGINYVVRSGNSLENIQESFPGAQFVDLCYPGTDAAGYQDWSILRLVFEDYNGSLMLTAIIHSEATI